MKNTHWCRCGGSATVISTASRKRARIYILWYYGQVINSYFGSQWNCRIYLWNLFPLSCHSSWWRREYFNKTSPFGCIHRLHLCRSPPTSKCPIITLNCIWCWGSSPEALSNEEYLFIAITPGSTLTWSGSTWYGHIYGSTRSSEPINCL